MKINMIKKSLYFLVISVLFLSCESDEEIEIPISSKATQSDVVTEGQSVRTMKGSNEVPNVTIVGTVINGGNATLILEANTDRGSIMISKATTNANGDFKLKGAIQAMGLYQLRLDEIVQKGQDPKVIPMTLVPEDKLTLELNFNDFNKSVVYKGTEWSGPLNGYMDKMKDFIDWQMSIVNPKK